MTKEQNDYINYRLQRATDTLKQRNASSPHSSLILITLNSEL
jgi:hypothetical protein